MRNLDCSPWIVVLLFALFSPVSSAAQKAQVESVLDNLHVFASRADGNRYFALFDKNASFIGTDVTEYWSLEEFKKFAMPYFSTGKGWTYIPRERKVHFSEDEKIAWFHEVLDNETYGTTRGTGVLLFDNNQWKILQYHLAIPVPNELSKDITKKIKAFEREVK